MISGNSASNYLIYYLFNWIVKEIKVSSRYSSSIAKNGFQVIPVIHISCITYLDISLDIFKIYRVISSFNPLT